MDILKKTIEIRVSRCLWNFESMEEPVLVLSDYSKPFSVQIDASNFAI